MNFESHPPGLSPARRASGSAMSPGRAAVRILFTGIPAYLGWFLANVALALLMPLFLLLELVKKPQVIRRICISFMRFFFLRYLPFVRMYRLEQTPDLETLAGLRGGLLVANHTSWLDAIVLLCLVPDVQILVSRRYGRVPLVSRIMGLLGCVFVDRRNRDSVAEAVTILRRVLERGGTLAVFPEGTRAPRGELKPFQEAFFSLAKEVGVSVRPTILHFDTPFLGPKAENFLTRKCAILKIRVLPAEVADARDKGRDLAFRVRRLMKREMAALDAPPTL